MSRKAEKHLKLTLPQGCKEISEDLSNDELVKRLKLLTQAFHEMSNDENEEFKPLALYLASQHFLEHPSKDVRLLIACCIADILRVFVPEAPYTEPDQLKEIFMFLAEQLAGLKKPESPSFKRYFYLLETLAWVKSFNISLELPDNSEIIAKLFSTAFNAIHPQHSPKVSIFMLDILCPLLSEADTIQNDVINTFLTYLIEPYKSENRPAYEMAKDLVKRTSSVLEPYLEIFLNNSLLQSSSGKKDRLVDRVYDVIHALFTIAPSILNNVLPQLEFKLKSGKDEDRVAACKLLSRLFSAPNNTLPQQHKSLWNAFLSRFNDIDLSIRRLVTQSIQEIIINNPDLLDDRSSNTSIVDQLRHRQHDSDENVRMDVVKTIIGAAKADIRVVPDELLECVKERTRDKKFKIRKEALVGLGQIYKKYNNDPEVLKRIEWVRNKIFYAYYQISIEDKILVERILNTSLVPYTMDSAQRMEQLYKLYANLDEHAVRVMQEIFRTQYCFKGVLRSVIDLLNQPNNTSILNNKIIVISKHLPESDKAVKELLKFFKLLQSDAKLKVSLQNLIAPQCSCKKAEGFVKEIIKKLGNQTPQNLLYATVKQLLERVAPLMIDSQAISCLMSHVESISQSRTASDADQGLSVEAGLKLLQMLAQLFVGCVHSEGSYACLLRFLKNPDPFIVDMALQILATCGNKQLPPEHISTFVPLLEKMATDGTPKHAKHALRCINVLCEDKEEVFARTYERLSVRLTGVNLLNFSADDSCNKDLKLNAADDDVDALLVTSIVAIGHLSDLSASQFSTATTTLVSKFIFPEILIQDRPQEDGEQRGGEEWCDDESVSQQTWAKLESLKMVVRWLLSTKSPAPKVNPALRLFYTMILCEGDLMERGLISKAEMARLRLQAGKCLLKLAQEPLYAEKIKLVQFSTLALLINDPCLEVRKQFDAKLHKGLMSFRLPIQYMSILCLGALDPIKSRRTWVRKVLMVNVAKRREFLKQNASTATSSSIFSFLPDYVLPYAIHLLAHDPDLSSHKDVNALKTIKDCLSFLLDALLTRASTVPLSFYRRMLSNIKNTEDAQYPENAPQADKDEANKKLYAICDLTTHLLANKASHQHHHGNNDDDDDTGIEPVLPAKLYRPLNNASKNTKEYLSAEMINHIKKSKKQTASQQTSSKRKSGKKPTEDEDDEDEDDNEGDDNDPDVISPPVSPLSSHSSATTATTTADKKAVKLKTARGLSKSQRGGTFNMDNSNNENNNNKNNHNHHHNINDDDDDDENDDNKHNNVSNKRNNKKSGLINSKGGRKSKNGKENLKSDDDDEEDDDGDGGGDDNDDEKSESTSQASEKKSNKGAMGSRSTRSSTRINDGEDEEEEDDDGGAVEGEDEEEEEDGSVGGDDDDDDSEVKNSAKKTVKNELDGKKARARDGGKVDEEEEEEEGKKKQSDNGRSNKTKSNSKKTKLEESVVDDEEEDDEDDDDQKYEIIEDSEERPRKKGASKKEIKGVDEDDEKDDGDDGRGDDDSKRSGKRSMKKRKKGGDVQKTSVKKPKLSAVGKVATRVSKEVSHGSPAERKRQAAKKK